MRIRVHAADVDLVGRKPENLSHLEAASRHRPHHRQRRRPAFTGEDGEGAMPLVPSAGLPALA
ncbi:hypothetical protein [Actinoplanes solisilvae]|uniref:hypothetical protein n=1 Tax=Actinoplanes solisilvae TaxID=2486853 RepID=UPI000FDB5A5F|nr:hypothetical protein [Actinoplanes solisilvae]